MEEVFRDLSMAFKEISFITFKWIKDTHHSVQEQEVRLDRRKKKARGSLKITSILCIDQHR